MEEVRGGGGWARVEKSRVAVWDLSVQLALKHCGEMPAEDWAAFSENGEGMEGWEWSLSEIPQQYSSISPGSLMLRADLCEESSESVSRRWTLQSHGTPLDFQTNTDALTTISSTTGSCEKQHWCLLLQLPNSSQRAFCGGWQNGWVSAFRAVLDLPEPYSIQLGTAVPWLRSTCACLWSLCQRIPAAWLISNGWVACPHSPAAQ